MYTYIDELWIHWSPDAIASGLGETGHAPRLYSMILPLLQWPSIFYASFCIFLLLLWSNQPYCSFFGLCVGVWYVRSWAFNTNTLPKFDNTKWCVKFWKLNKLKAETDFNLEWHSGNPKARQASLKTNSSHFQASDYSHPTLHIHVHECLINCIFSLFN